MEKSKNTISKILISSLFGLILTVSIILRFYQIGKLPFWNDEIFTFFSTKMSFGETFKLDPNMSLYNLVASLWVRFLPSATDGVLRTLSAIISVLSIPVVFLLGSAVGIDKKKSIAVGLLASTLISVNAYHIQYAQEFRAYSLLFLLSALSSLFLLKAAKRNEDTPHSPNPWWFWFIVTSVASIYSHFFAIFVLMAQALSLLILRLNDKENFPLQEALGSFIAIAIFSIPVMSATFTKGADQISWITKPNQETLEKFAIRITGNQGLPLLSLSILTTTLGLLAGIKTWLKKDPLVRFKLTLIAGGAVLPIAASLAISFLMTPIFVDRYLILIMPYFAILSAVGIVALANLGEKRLIPKIATTLIAAVLFVSVTILSTMGIKSYFNEFQKEDWRGASQFLTDNCSSPDDLRLYYMTYTERDPIYYNSELKSQIWNWGKIASKSPSVEEIGGYITDPYDQACLVISHVSQPYIQVQKNIESALEQKFPKVASSKFYQIEVKIYTKEAFPLPQEETEATSGSEEIQKDLATTTTQYYVVEIGDSLWSISQKYYGKGTEWSKIITTNGSKTIHPGQELTIPSI